MPPTHTTHDILLIGAGLAGTITALTLARQGRRVLLLERDLREQDRIVGELLQPGGVAALHRLGLASCLDEIEALPLRGYRLLYHGEAITFWYPLASRFPLWGKGERKRYEGRSLRNGKLVQKLRAMALAESGIDVVEGTAKALLRSEDGRAVIGVSALVDGETRFHFAKLTIGTDGQASTFRSCLSTTRPVARSRFYGLRVDAVLGDEGVSLGVLGTGWPAGVYQISPSETRILVDVPRDTPLDIRAHIDAHIVPSLPGHLHGAVRKAMREERIKSMPNSWLPSVQTRMKGVLLLGDAYNMRHPISGSGMTVALQDVVVLSEVLHPDCVPDLGDYGVVGRQVDEFRRRRKKHSFVLNVLAQVLYLLVAGREPHWLLFQTGFVAYARSTEERMEEMAAMMGGLLPSPWRLFYHLVAVTIFALRLHVRKQYRKSVWGVPWALVQCLVASVKVLYVAVPYVLREL